jgi:hypothetical protein
MEMRRRVLIEIYSDDNPIKPAYLRHSFAPRQIWIKFSRDLAGYFHVDCVRANIDLITPGDLAVAANIDLFKSPTSPSNFSSSPLVV